MSTAGLISCLVMMILTITAILIFIFVMATRKREPELESIESRLVFYHNLGGLWFRDRTTTGYERCKRAVQFSCETFEWTLRDEPDDHEFGHRNPGYNRGKININWSPNVPQLLTVNLDGYGVHEW